MAEEERNRMIEENAPKLIKMLLKSNKENKNFHACENFFWNQMKNHRFLSTNSHEVRRTIAAMVERFELDNLPEFGAYYNTLCSKLINHPLCTQHYELDIHWSIIIFIFTLAHRPIENVLRNRDAMEKERQSVLAAIELDEKTDINELETCEYDESCLKELLREDFIPPPDYGDDGSELSDWSDLDDTLPTVNVISRVKNETTVAEPKQRDGLFNIKPPQAESPFKTYNNANANAELSQIRNYRTKDFMLADIESKDEALANFAYNYGKYLNDKSNHLVNFNIPSTAPEHFLLREIILMFAKPANCTFFTVTEAGVIMVRDNITIPSVTAPTIGCFLEDKIVPSLQMMFNLNKFFDTVYSNKNYTPPRTLEYYAAALKVLLEPVNADIIKFEIRLLKQSDGDILTLVTFCHAMTDAFNRLDLLYRIHDLSVLDKYETAPHIRSMYLLTGLLRASNSLQTYTDCNTAMSLLIFAIKVFCNIIDTWWRDGLLNDWQKEFIVESVGDNGDYVICLRHFSKQRPKFFLSTKISNQIQNSKIFKLISGHVLESSATLSLLHDLNKLGELRESNKRFHTDHVNLYKSFMHEIMNRVSKFPEHENEKNVNNSKIFENNEVENNDEKNEETNSFEDILNQLDTKDEHLLGAFLINRKQKSVDKELKKKLLANSTKRNILSILERLNKVGGKLPLEHIILTSLRHVLEARISIADRYVMRLYRDEFDIRKHVRHIRNIMLLEANSIMQRFYLPIFELIEAGKPWANDSLLTVLLDDIVSMSFPKMSSLICIEITSALRSQNDKVYEAIEALMMTYALNRETSLIITPDHIANYNRVMHMVLKIKWGIWTLENMRFSRKSHKSPFAPLELIDLTLRRLEQVRFWLLYAINSIHFHVTAHVISAMGQKIDAKFEKCANLEELKIVHSSYVKVLCKHCLADDYYEPFRSALDQLLHLIYVVDIEWKACYLYRDQSHPLSLDISSSDDDNDYGIDFLAITQIDQIEKTYIRCHQLIASILNQELYHKDEIFLVGLHAAFNTSVPY